MSQNSAASSWLARAARGVGLAAWVITGLLGLSTIIIVLLVRALPSDVTTYLTERPSGQLLLNAALYVLAVVIVIGVPYWFSVYVLRRPQEKGHYRRFLGIATPIDGRKFGLFLLCIVGYLAGTVLFSTLAAMLPGFNVDQQQNVGFKNLSGAGDLVLAFIALVVLPPIAEELLFRGYLFGKLRQRSGFWFSAIFTSLIFGLVHLQWNVGIDVFVLSIFLCVLREKTGSLWMSMLLHGVKNGVAYFFLFIAPLLGISIH